MENKLPKQKITTTVEACLLAVVSVGARKRAFVVINS
jgi:hypothetical protein